MSAMDGAESSVDGTQGAAADNQRDLRIPGALARTAFSSEQSLMSWIRTSLSLTTFGFSVAKFFDYWAQHQQDVHLTAGPRWLGMCLIGAGVVALLLAILEHARRIRALAAQGLPPEAKSFSPFGAAIAILAIGIAALASVAFGWSP